jgi:hypothetical protein
VPAPATDLVLGEHRRHAGRVTVLRHRAVLYLTEIESLAARGRIGHDAVERCLEPEIVKLEHAERLPTDSPARGEPNPTAQRSPHGLSPHRYGFHGQAGERLQAGAIVRTRSREADERHLVSGGQRLDQAVENECATGGRSRMGQQRRRDEYSHAPRRWVALTPVGRC